MDSNVVCSVVYAESSDADPLANAFESAIKVSVANAPTLELTCRYRAPSSADLAQRAARSSQRLGDDLAVGLVVVGQADQVQQRRT